MFQDVAVPDEQSWDIVQRFDTGDLARIGDHSILGSCLPGQRSVLSRDTRTPAYRLAPDYFKLHHVNMDRVGVLCEVEDFPYFDGT